MENYPTAIEWKGTRLQISKIERKILTEEKSLFLFMVSQGFAVSRRLTPTLLLIFAKPESFAKSTSLLLSVNV